MMCSCDCCCHALLTGSPRRSSERGPWPSCHSTVACTRDCGSRRSRRTQRRSLPRCEQAAEPSQRALEHHLPSQRCVVEHPLRAVMV